MLHHNSQHEKITAIQSLKSHEKYFTKYYRLINNLLKY